MKLLEGKVAIVTGAGQGIGREIALLLASEGSKIVVADINYKIAEDTAKEIDSRGVEAMPYELDVGSGEKVKEMVDKILDKFKRIDILINNAGITRDNLILRLKDEQWDDVLRVNLKGAFNCIKMVSKVMLKARSGRIVNISSIIGLIGNAGQANYAASKAGLIGLTKSAARELGSRGINVNAVAPGYILTAMTEKLPEEVKKKMLEQIPLGKFGDAKEVAKAVLFLVSEASDYITGQVISVDGGMAM
ncbi:MAG: 3-oxoacyl-[acyl-carrier-protein] reductase [Candidatus Omnitrophica bacterium]|nr:3-oxoacyl-[acyl-carrier-protein] reductase [Candidatus Omnitrophota bacterium]